MTLDLDKLEAERELARSDGGKYNPWPTCNWAEAYGKALIAEVRRLRDDDCPCVAAEAIEETERKLEIATKALERIRDSGHIGPENCARAALAEIEGER